MLQEKNLSGEVVGIHDLTSIQRDEMYSLMDSYYDNLSKQVFERDLSEKKDVVILRDGPNGAIKGFSTLRLLEQTVDGNPVTALFSGDTILDRGYWGTDELIKCWGKYAFSLIDQMQGKELYWFLMSKGYRTYRFLPVFFNEFYPRRGVDFPQREKRILDAFASSKFPDNYDPNTGVISFNGKKDRLKEGIAEIDEARMKNADIQYFAERNPRWYQGDELACLVRLTKNNFNRIAHRVMGEIDHG